MYPINPYMNTPAVAPLTMEAFVAPADFNPDAQELNIVTAFAAYADVNKKYIYSVSPAVASTTLDALTGRSYAYAENSSGYTVVASGTINWTSGSTKRNVIVIDTNSSIDAKIAVGGVWCYCSYNCKTAFGSENGHVKYIHFETLNSLKYIATYAFGRCENLVGKIIVPNSCESVGSQAFYNCIHVTGLEWLSDANIPQQLLNYQNTSNLFQSLIINSKTANIGDAAFARCAITSLTLLTYLTSLSTNAFYNCPLVNVNSFNKTPPSITSSSFYLVNKMTCIIHVPNGSLADYRAQLIGMSLLI